MNKQSIWTMLSVVIILFLLTGCAGIPKEIRRQMEMLHVQIENGKKQVQERKQTFVQAKKSSQYREFHQQYDERENWMENYSKAETRLADADKVYNDQIKPLLDENDPRKINILSTHAGRVALALREAKDLSAAARKRMQFLEHVRDNAPQLIKTAEDEMVQLSSVFSALAPVVEQAKSDYPQKDENLTSRLAVPRQLHDTAEEALKNAQKQLNEPAPDYAVLGDNTAMVNKNLGLIREQDTEIRKKIGELGKSYSKILIDMRAEYFVQVGRTSWDNSSDWKTDRDYLFPPRQVEEGTYEYFANLPETKTIAGFYRSWGRRNLAVKIDKGKWNDLKINCIEKWANKRHDASELWINDLPVKYNHKYTLVEGSQQSESDWQEVSETFFEENFDHLGMILVSKPFGMYEEEVIKVAAPPGMELVGNPKYGRWEGEGNNRRWGWFESYLFYHWMFGSSRRYYGYNEWNNWNRNYSGRQPYYGGTYAGRKTNYGTSSPDVRSKYAGSSFARTGGFRTQARTVRGAGPSARGGGPGSRGK